jgi:hypothetical protein
MSWNPIVHFSVHKNPCLVHILSQINRDQTVRNTPLPQKINKIQDLTSCHFLQRLWFCFLLRVVRLHLNCYKQRWVISIVTNIMLYICNLSPINLAKYGAWQVLRHTDTDHIRPEQSHGHYSNCSRPQPKRSNAISRGDQSGCCTFQRGILFCGSSSNSHVTEKGDRETEAFVFIQYTPGENLVFSDVLTLVSRKTWINSRTIL